MENCEATIFYTILTLIEKSKIISKDAEVAEPFNKFFIKSVVSLDLEENKSLLNVTVDLIGPAKLA